MGSKFISIYPGKDNEKFIIEGETIAGKNAEIVSLTQDIGDLAKRLNDTFGETQKQQIKNTVSSASLAVQYIFLLTLFAGILALVASIFSNRDQRTKETAIMHAIGANRFIILQSAAFEFFILGILSGLTAIFFSTILSSIIFSQFLDLAYSPNFLILGFSFIAGVLFIFMGGILSIRRTIYTSPVITLRES